MFAYFIIANLFVCSLLTTVAQANCVSHSQNLPTPLYNHVGGYSAAANSVFLMGGQTSGFADVTSVYQLDLDATSPDWTVSGTSIPDPVWYATGCQTTAVVDNVFHVVGVYQLTGPVTVRRFDTSTSPISVLPDVAQPAKLLTLGCVANSGTHIYMIDGDGNTDTQNVFVQIYDIAADTWTMHTVAAPFDTSNFAGISSVSWRNQYCYYANDKLFVFGGQVDNYYYTDGMWRYDIANQQFVSIGTLPQALAFGMAVYDGYDHLYLVGGQSYGCNPGCTTTYTNTIPVFDISSESLTGDVITTLNSFSHSVAAVLSGSIWIFGGYNGAAILDQVQVCDIADFLPTATPTTATPTTGIPTTVPTTAAPTTTSPTTSNVFASTTELLSTTVTPDESGAHRQQIGFFMCVIFFVLI